MYPSIFQYFSGFERQSRPRSFHRIAQVGGRGGGRGGVNSHVTFDTQLDTTRYDITRSPARTPRHYNASDSEDIGRHATFLNGFCTAGEETLLRARSRLIIIANRRKSAEYFRYSPTLVSPAETLPRLRRYLRTYMYASRFSIFRRRRIYSRKQAPN